MIFITPLFYVSTLVCTAEMPVDVQGDDRVLSVKVEGWAQLMSPGEDQSSLEKQIAKAKAEIEAQIRRLEGGVGSYYEYYSAVGNLLCLQFALNRVEDPKPKLTQRQKLLAEDIKDNFQKRIHFLANAHSAGMVNGAELIKLKINALLFEREMLQLSVSAPGAIVSVQEKVVKEAHALVDMRRKQTGVATKDELERAEQLREREVRMLEQLKE
ncbi:hypothetical protein ICN84_10585 [Akkermansia glycaniphila]|uniref:hypothetical protein n=1 Tax=Akkermansia glycaniphila TaxID=1679444 RepID=UPI001C0256F6|nr:hypothetical protein [Akkermansia glycaniphila]MBT9450512.1 hypothetical protein [Akkermansia glycaniphila]